MRKVMLATIAPVALMAGAVAMGSAAAPEPCDEAAGTVAPPVIGETQGIAVVHDRTVTVVTSKGRRTALVAGGEGVPRHPALGPGGRLAYVEDRRGPDLLHVVGAPWSSPVAAGGEVTHPAWSPAGALAWAEDLQRLRLRASGGEVRGLGRPPGTEGVFSPVFVDEGTLVAVAAEPVSGYDGEDAALDNLWEMDLGAGTWHRRTSFGAEGEAWSVLRTPVPMADGSLRLVRVAGSGASEAAPTAELWALEGAGARFLRPLPVDAVLAGRLESDLVLNVPDPETGAYRLLLEGVGVDLGCGTAMADPLVPEEPDAVDDEKEGSAAPQGDTEVSDGTLAIVVGDFETRGEAVRVSSALAGVGPVRVLTHGESPAAVAPGVWAVGIGIPEGVPVDEALEAFRARFPRFRDRSWITVP